MDQNQIIQKVVEEVIARMAAAGAAPAAAAQAHAAPQAAATDILPSDLPKYIDHTLLKPEAAVEQIDVLCDEAAKHRFWSVCVN
ncbi:MAG: hypothetical protein Q8M76_05560, partial [Spirochaetaceae bacterium]|nr:hypothetical protein [Spirochaetaceae bacterium]